MGGCADQATAAQDNARDHDALRGQIETEQRQDTQDQRELGARNDDADTLGAVLGWTGEQAESLPDHLARCREATALRLEIATLTKDLHDRPAPEDGDTAEHIRQAIDQLKTDQQLLRAETETRLATHLEAKRRIEAVGGDDALARIAAARENLLLEACAAIAICIAAPCWRGPQGRSAV